MTTVIEKLKQLAAEASKQAGSRTATGVEQTYYMGKENAYKTAIILLEEKKCTN